MSKILVLKKKINLKNIKETIYDEELVNSNALQMSIALRRDSLLFTDLNRVWEYDLQTHSFYEFDIFNKITELLKGKLINNSFKKSVMNYLPPLDLQQVQEYGKSMYFNEEDLISPEMLWKYDGWLKNEQYINQIIKNTVRYNENLKKEYEVISFDY